MPRPDYLDEYDAIKVPKSIASTYESNQDVTGLVEKFLDDIQASLHLGGEALATYFLRENKIFAPTGDSMQVFSQNKGEVIAAVTQTQTDTWFENFSQRIYFTQFPLSERTDAMIRELQQAERIVDGLEEIN